VIEASSMVAEVAPPGLEQVFFVSSGSEAVESALKLARCYHVANGEPGRYKAIAREWSYHGTTLGALAVTAIPGFRAPYLPMLADFVRHVPNTLGAPLDGSVPAAELPCVQGDRGGDPRRGPRDGRRASSPSPCRTARGAHRAATPATGPELRRHLRPATASCSAADEVISAFGRLGYVVRLRAAVAA
jgi:adenosylmethionine-8-amino-7-oxononanoate aminotransferase